MEPSIEAKKDFERHAVGVGEFGFGVNRIPAKAQLVSASYVTVKEEVARALRSVGEQVENISERIEHLENKVLLLEDRVRGLEEFEGSGVDVEEVPVEISRKEAKDKILKLFEQKGELGYGEIMEALGIDLRLIVEICDELEKERRIEAIK